MFPLRKLHVFVRRMSPIEYSALTPKSDCTHTHVLQLFGRGTAVRPTQFLSGIIKGASALSPRANTVSRREGARQASVEETLKKKKNAPLLFFSLYHLLECREHGGGVLRRLQALRDSHAHTSHLHPRFSSIAVCRRQYRRQHHLIRAKNKKDGKGRDGTGRRSQSFCVQNRTLVYLLNTSEADFTGIRQC